MTGHRKPREARVAGRRAGLLAVSSAVMVAAALAAAFLTSPGPPPPAATSGKGWCCPATAPVPRPRPGHRRWCCPAAAAWATRPPGTTASRTYPPGRRTYPPGSRSYPAPLARSYPPPLSPGTPAPGTPHPSQPPAPTPPPGGDLPPPAPLSPPLEGVVTTDVPAWNAATSSRAQLAVSYVSMARPLAPSFLHSAMRVADGAEPVIEITPTAPGQPAVTLESIAAGDSDKWLGALRDQITALGRPVILSFAPEANGKWYSWGLDPAGFTAAWAHAHAVIGTVGVTWMWQVSAHNPTDPATADIAAYWPGGQLVDWAGLDGYDYVPGDHFEQRFASSLAEIAGWWTGPVLIAETAVSPATRNMPDDIADLFAGVAAHRLLGLVYFDLKPACPPECGFYHPDFRIENNPAALAAYIKAVHGAW